MAGLVTTVLSQAPIVGHAFSKPSKSPEKGMPSFLTPPPPYEKVVAPSKLGQLSDYVWRQGTSMIMPDVTATNSLTQTTIDKKQVENVITLIHVASEMDQAGQHQMAKDLYIMGIDRMLSALPLESDPRLKLALEYRLAQFKEKKELDLDQPFEETMMAIANVQELTDEELDAEQLSIKSRLTHIVSSIASYGVDVVMKSPLPGAVSSSVSYAVAGLESVDATYRLRERTWNLAVQGVAKAIEMDKQYQIHRMIMDKMLATCNALLQAAAAHQHQQQQQ